MKLYREIPIIKLAKANDTRPPVNIRPLGINGIGSLFDMLANSETIIEIHFYTDFLKKLN